MSIHQIPVPSQTHHTPQKLKKERQVLHIIYVGLDQMNLFNVLSNVLPTYGRTL